MASMHWAGALIGVNHLKNDPTRFMPSSLDSAPTVRPESGVGNRIRVTISDDHPAIREALARTIGSKLGMELCGEAGSAEETRVLIEQLRPNVAIVDISLADVHGLDLVQEIRAGYPDIQVIVFSMYDENVYAERALRAGALGYVMKSEPVQHLVDAILRVQRGEIYLSQNMASSILNHKAFNRAASPGFAIDELTERERTVFTLLGKGYSVAEITDTLRIEAKTVETYRRRAKEKLGLQTVGELLQYALRWTQG